MKNVTGCSNRLLWHFYSMGHVTNVCVYICVCDSFLGARPLRTDEVLLLTLHPPRFYCSLHQVCHVCLSGDPFPPSCWGQLLRGEKQLCGEIRILMIAPIFFTVRMCTAETTVFASLNFKPFVETFKLKIQTEALLLSRYVNG